jgi:hypothetical protein
LLDEDPTKTHVVIFAVSNFSLIAILAELFRAGYEYGKNVSLYSDQFLIDFEKKIQTDLKWEPDRHLLQYATAYTLNSQKPVFTTICGSWLFLEALRNTPSIGAIAEVGAFECGNVLLAVQSPVWRRGRQYLVFDSFEGFPELGANDPTVFRAGDFRTYKTLPEILAPLTQYNEVRVIKGFVPGTFSEVDADTKFSIVFYDCDLYQPALDTFAFFWNRLVPGGVMIIHDYFAEPGGFAGVRKATHEFFDPLGVRITQFWQSTMAVLIK